MSTWLELVPSVAPNPTAASVWPTFSAQNAVGGGVMPAIEVTKKPFQAPPNESDQPRPSENCFSREAVTSAPRAVDLVVVWPRSVPTNGFTLPWNRVRLGASTRIPVARACETGESASSKAAVSAANKRRRRLVANASSFLERWFASRGRQVFWLGRAFPDSLRVVRLAFPAHSEPVAASRHVARTPLQRPGRTGPSPPFPFIPPCGDAHA